MIIMRKKLLFASLAAGFCIPQISFGQTPIMGSTINYVLFTSSGAVGNTGVSHITGNIGTQVGDITSFGNIDGTLHSADLATAAAVLELSALYTELSGSTTTVNHGDVLGTGEILSPGVYQIAAAGSIAGTLTLDAGGDANAQFIFKIGGALTTTSGTEIILLNNAKACNIFWVAEGAIGMAARTTMKGTLIANNAAISMAAGGQLEGRMFSTTGAVAIDGTTARIPLGCGLAELTGPPAPTLASTECFALFTANGALANTGTTIVTGDVGTNGGATSGFVSGDVTGTIHLVPDTETATCASDLTLLYTYLNNLPTDIELLYPATLGNKLVLTPHSYLLNAATIISDTLFLNAQDNADAVFVLSITGALSTSVGATIFLLNGAQAKNVFWVVNGNVNLNTDATFIGTIVSDNGTIDLAVNANLSGRALTTSGIFSTNNSTIVVPTSCSSIGVPTLHSENGVRLYPNPASYKLMIDLASKDAKLNVLNMKGQVILTKQLDAELNEINVSTFTDGVYIIQLQTPTSLITERIVVKH
jgi:hypothetical protein